MDIHFIWIVLDYQTFWRINLLTLAKHPSDYSWACYAQNTPKNRQQTKRQNDFHSMRLFLLKWIEICNKNKLLMEWKHFQTNNNVHMWFVYWQFIWWIFVFVCVCVWSNRHFLIFDFSIWGWIHCIDSWRF